MSDEVDAETQATMQLKLKDDVRALIRDELALALNDGAWLSSISFWAVSERVISSTSTTNGVFRSQVKNALKDILDKSYV
jgi:hypothetical protein